MINIAHFVVIETSSRTFRLQNFFTKGSNAANTQIPNFDVAFPNDPVGGEDSSNYGFAPFSVQGSSSQLNGENEPLLILLPFTRFSVQLVEEGNGNRLSKLQLKTIWLEGSDPDGNGIQYSTLSRFTEFYVGIGASFSETTIELRFRSAMDAVGARFPGDRFTRDNVGILPVERQIRSR